jgi:phosphotriesterase-related protein
LYTVFPAQEDTVLNGRFFMPEIIRTVLGDISPSNLGVILGHDHLITHPPSTVTDDDLVMDDIEAAVQELEAFKRAGGGAVVEMTTVDYGRDAGELEEVSRRSGVHVIAATGFNKGKFADALTNGSRVEDIELWMVDEVMAGVRPFWRPGPHLEHAKARAGLIKASTGLDGPNGSEVKVMKAAVYAHRVTNAPIGTHTEKGTWGLEQAQFFLEHGVPASKVLIGHLDLKPELPYLLEIARTGVNLGFDQFGKEKYLPDQTRVELLVRLCEAGFGQQLILGGDMARKSYFRAYGGGPGLTHLPITIRNLLLNMGLPPETVQDLLEHNASRWLSFTPKG